MNGSASRVIDLLGLKLAFHAHPAQRRCPGHNPFREPSIDWVDCDNAPSTPSTRSSPSTKCDRCTAHDATYASYLHHAHVRGAGELPRVLQQQLDQENLLYVAGFRDGSIKVGTSKATRIHTRLAEQGAWHARVVASATNGIIVREVEADVTDKLGVRQSVSVQRKIKGLALPVENEALLAQIDVTTRSIHDLIDDQPSERVSQRSIPWTSPVINDEAWTRATEYPARLSEGVHAIEVLTMSGRVAGFHRDGLDDVFLADFGTLIGIELEVTSAEPDPLTIQSSLF